MRKTTVTTRDKLTEALRLLREAAAELTGRHELMLSGVQLRVGAAIAFCDGEAGQANAEPPTEEVSDHA